jgi:hypothetical protein
LRLSAAQDERQPRGYFSVTYGFNHANGTVHAATMIDRPGGGVIAGNFSFESYAPAEDLGLAYCSVRWGFLQGFNGITGE